MWHRRWNLTGSQAVISVPDSLEMLRLYIHGMSYSEIARKMDCSASGVRWNFQEMIAKAGYSCKEDLIAAALESKLIVTTLK